MHLNKIIRYISKIAEDNNGIRDESTISMHLVSNINRKMNAPMMMMMMMVVVMVLMINMIVIVKLSLTYRIVTEWRV